MKRTVVLIILLIAGLIFSQLLPVLFGVLPDSFLMLKNLVTMTLLAYIMIQVGREFEIDLTNKKQYAVDYGVAATAAAFPWIFCSIYFLIFLMPMESSSGRSPWIEAFLVARFAAPTSAGVLFSMLAAAGLTGTWAFRKTRILAIFDDLDTVLFMIPLKILMVGLAWQLGVALFIMTLLIVLGLKYYRKINFPTSWPWILTYSAIITALSEILYIYTKNPVTLVGVHIEVLLPAFLLGCMLRTHDEENVIIPGEDPPAMTIEERAGLIISCAFMFFVGLSMPSALGENAAIKIDMSAWMILVHVIMITFISNLGKMFVLFCYKNEASYRERLAVSVAMFPRGEVGAGVLAVSLSYGIQGPFVTIAFLSLVLNLVLSGFFIYLVKYLLSAEPIRLIKDELGEKL